MSIPPPPPLPPGKPVVGPKFTTTLNSQLIGTSALPVIEAPEELEGVAPVYFFFYGSLMDSEVLGHILNLPEEPKVEPATINGFRIKMWGIYPSLIPDSEHTGGLVSGTTWKVETAEQLRNLSKYETSVYRHYPVKIHRKDGSILDGRVFCWAGDPDNSELEEGSFDLVHYQTYFKSSVVRRRESDEF